MVNFQALQDELILKVLLVRCIKIKTLSLEPTSISDDSLKHIRQHLNSTLEELNLGGPIPTPNIDISFTGLLQLKSMQRLQMKKMMMRKAKSETASTSVSRTGSRPGDPEAGPRRFWGRGRSGWTL